MARALLPRPDKADTLPSDVLHIIDTARRLGLLDLERLEQVRARVFGGKNRLLAVRSYYDSVQVVHAAVDDDCDPDLLRYMSRLTVVGYGISHVAAAAATHGKIPLTDYARIVAPWLAAGLPLKVAGDTVELSSVPLPVTLDNLTAAAEQLLAAHAATPAT